MLAYLEFIHCLVETLDRYFENVVSLLYLYYNLIKNEINIFNYIVWVRYNVKYRKGTLYFRRNDYEWANSWNK